MTELGDLLAAAGYSSGDFVPLWTASTINNTTTSSNTFRNIAGATIRGTRNDFVAAGATPEVAMVGQADDNGDQVDIRLRDVNLGNTIVSETNVVSSGEEDAFLMGPAAYTAGDLNGDSRLVGQVRNSDNTTTVAVRGPTIAVGVTL